MNLCIYFFFKRPSSWRFGCLPFGWARRSEKKIPEKTQQAFGSFSTRFNGLRWQFQKIYPSQNENMATGYPKHLQLLDFYLQLLDFYFHVTLREEPCQVGAKGKKAKLNELAETMII